MRKPKYSPCKNQRSRTVFRGFGQIHCPATWDRSYCPVLSSVNVNICLRSALAHRSQKASVTG
jgi:hypothetical protein